MAESGHKLVRPELVRRLVAVCFCVVPPLSLAAQGRHTGGTPAGAVSVVMEYRAGWMEDSTAFDACSIQRALGGPGGQPLSLSSSATRLLHGSETNPCATSSRAERRIVRVDSLSTSDSAAVVHLMVVKGERVHREVFTLRALPQAPGWGVRDVRLWGALRLHAPPATEARREGR